MTASAEDLRRYQLYMVDRGASPISINAAIIGLKFFFNITLNRPELMAKMQSVHLPLKLPVVLSREEVARLISCAGSLRNKTVLSVAYGAGLRVSELAALKVSDIDSQRMTLRIEQGKGSKDRYAMLSPAMLECLRTWWRTARAEGHQLHGGWLFPGFNPIEQISTRQLSRVIHAAADDAQIDKRIAMHTLRHYFEFRTMPSPDGGTRARVAISSIVRDLYSAYSMASERLQKGEQLVIGSIAADPPRLWFNFVQRSLLHFEICIEIYLCRLN